MKKYSNKIVKSLECKEHLGSLAGVPLSMMEINTFMLKITCVSLNWKLLCFAIMVTDNDP